MPLTVLGETLSYLRFNCIWPRKGHELKPGKCFYFKFILMMASNSVLLIGSTGHLIVSLHHNSSNITEDLVIIIAEIGVYYFISLFVFRQRKIAQIYLDLSDFKSDNDKRNQQLSALSKKYKLFIDFAIIFFCLYPFFTRKMCEKHNKFSYFKEVCGLLVTTWMPFNIQQFPTNQILYMWQCYAILFTMKGAALISFAIMETLEHLVLRIQHVKTMFAKAINTKEKKLLCESIKYHSDIFELAKRVDKYYKDCLFVHVLFSGALFGCIGYSLMETLSLNSLCIFSGWVLALIIVCLSGQHLIDEAISVSDAVYDTEWYNADADFQRHLVLVLLRSQKPIVVRAGPLSYVSHLIILTIYKTSYSYMMLLKARREST